MTLRAGLMVAAFAFMLWLFVAVAVRAWQGRAEFGAVEPGWWPFGEPVWRGVMRAFVAMGPFLLLFLGGGAVAAFYREDSSGFDTAVAVSALGLVGTLAIQLPIIFFNRPRFLVPPSLRDQPGALEEWRRRRPRAR